MSTSKESGYMSPLSGHWPLIKMAVKTMNPGQSYEENLDLTSPCCGPNGALKSCFSIMQLAAHASATASKW